jgi:Sulfotransferase family
MSERKLLFVGGLHRSGTTVVGRLLAAHPAVSGLRGTGVPEDEGQHLQDVYPPAAHFGGPGRFGFSAAAHLDESSPLATPDARRRLLAAWEPYWDGDGPVLLEKSPPNLVRTRFLQKLFPDACFLIVVRHPIAVSLATEKWGKPWTGMRSGPLVRHWVVCHERLLADAPHVRRLMIVRYEDLIADPDTWMSRMHEFAGVSPLPPAEHLDPGPNERYLGRWSERRRQPLRSLYLDRVARRYEERVNRFGYSLTAPEAAPAPAAALAA